MKKKALAWDTSTENGICVSFQWDTELSPQWVPVAQFFFPAKIAYQERLLWGIHQVLKASCWEKEDIDYLGVGLGPGSFTGLRIGVTTAQMWSHFLKKPVVGVCSFLCPLMPLLMSCSSFPSSLFLIVLFSASQGEVMALWGPVDYFIQKIKNPFFPWGVSSGSLPILAEKIKKDFSDFTSSHDSSLWSMIGEVGEKKYPHFLWTSFLPPERCWDQKISHPSSIYLPHSFSELIWYAIQAQAFFSVPQLLPNYVQDASARKANEQKRSLI